MKRVEVVPHYPKRQRELEQSFLKHSLTVRCEKWSGYLLEGSNLREEGVKKLLVDEHKESAFLAEEEHPRQPDILIQVSFLPGVTDNVGRSCEDLFALEDIHLRCYSSTLYALFGEQGQDKQELKGQTELIKELCQQGFYNPLIQDLTVYPNGSENYRKRFETMRAPQVHIHGNTTVETISFEKSDEELLELSKERCLALELDELHVIKDYFARSEVLETRKQVGLGLATDVEVEVLAQTWSEHCKHKIFAADINYINEDTGQTRTISSLYKSYIKKATKDINSSFLVSVFSDNAGIVRFDDQLDVCIKAETHNSPSALDPYGGALTGILGVNRDIMGCGLGAKPIANTNVFCVGPQNLEEVIGEQRMPQGLMAPREILKGIHAGVRDGGNKSGIPTVNGAMFFDADYAGKPLVFCGTVGVMPPRLADGRESKEKGAKVDDLIYVVGGKVGADGIHGATFSSMDLNESSPATAVQIGDPITQKRTLDFLLEARDLGLFTCVTDNGAGGISSSIGEMATLTNGCRIDLAKHPVKYPGLTPWEIMISESQERMTFAVDPRKAQAFEELALQRNVEATCLGHFNDSGFLSVFYEEQQVAYLSMHFLHEGLPPMTLTARYSESKTDEQKHWLAQAPSLVIAAEDSTREKLLTLLGRENIASKRQWVEQYDHEVQGGTLMKPFVGRKQRSPGNSGVVSLSGHGGQEHSAVAIGCGMAPRWSRYDAKVMAQMSVDEAVRNIIAQGANPDKICLLDNFCWPDPILSPKTPDGDYKLAQLVHCCEGLYDICLNYQTPLVSGKDSMKNDFRGVNAHGDPLTISIKPTLLVTAMGHVDQRFVSDCSLKTHEAVILLVGADQRTLCASEFEACYGVPSALEKPALTFERCFQTYRYVHDMIKAGLILSCHDVSEGGLLVALSEKLFDAEVDVSLTLDESIKDLDRFFFGEGPGQFIVSCSHSHLEAIMAMAREHHIPLTRLGGATPSQAGQLTVEGAGKTLLSVSTDKLLQAWEREWWS